MAVGFGCAASDYAAFVPGSISIAQRGGCSFLEIGRAAQQYGASACIVANNEAGVLNGRLGEPEEGALVTIPVVGTTTDIGEELIALVVRILKSLSYPICLSLCPTRSPKR
jgi:hypothetical protein